MTRKYIWKVKLLEEYKLDDGGVSFRGMFETECAPEHGHIHISQLKKNLPLDKVSLEKIERTTITITYDEQV
jgi:hypothetical protein